MRKWIPVLVIAAAFLATGAVYSRLPEQIPTHWNLSGEVDDWSGKAWGAFAIPLMLLAGLVIFHLIPRIDPRGANFQKFRSTYEILFVAIMLFMLGVHTLILASALGMDVSVARLMPLGAGILFVVVGNLLPRMRPNWFIGVRTPWTLASDRVWERTHRFSGRLFVGAGLVAISTAVLAPRLATGVLLASTGGVLFVAVVLYSYIAWRHESAVGTAGVREP